MDKGHFCRQQTGLVESKCGDISLHRGALQVLMSECGGLWFQFVPNVQVFSRIMKKKKCCAQELSGGIQNTLTTLDKQAADTKGILSGLFYL